MQASSKVDEVDYSIDDGPALPSINTSIILQIASRCDTPTTATLCRLHKSLRVPLRDLLFRHVEIQESWQLDAFARLVDEAENNDSAIKALAQVEYFIYRPTVLSRSAHDFRPSSTLMKLSEIPRLTSDGRKIFPRLIKARLTFNAASHFPLHVVRQQLAEVSSRIPRHISTCFLADIKILFLDKIMSNRSGDLHPALELLVIRNLTTVTITFALERDLLPSKDAAYFLIGQKALETVIIDIDEYLKYHEVTPTAKGKIKRMEEHAEPVRFALNDFSWWQNKYWKHFRELILVLDENQSQRFILSLRKVIVKDWWTDTWEKEWLRKNLKWTSRNSTRQPVRLFPFRNVRLYRDIPSV